MSNETELQKIFLDTVKTPYPVYAAGTKEGDAYSFIANSWLNHDPRSQYPVMTADALIVDLVKLTNPTPPAQPPPPPSIDPAAFKTVRDELISEYENVIPVASFFFQGDTCITDTFLSGSSRLDIVINYVAMGGATGTLDIFGIFNMVLSWIGKLAGPDSAIAILFFQTLFNIIKMFQKTPGTITGVATQLKVLADKTWETALQQNDQMRSAILSDWGKTRRTEALLNQGKLQWPTDLGQIVKAAGDGYELSCWQALLPVRYIIEFSYYFVHSCDSINYAACPSVWCNNSKVFWLKAGYFYWWNPPNSDGMNRLWNYLKVSKADVFNSQNGWKFNSDVGVWNQPDCVPHCG